MGERKEEEEQNPEACDRQEKVQFTWVEISEGLYLVKLHDGRSLGVL